MVHAEPIHIEEDVMERHDCDVMVIGGGQAGIPLARDLAARGRRVILAERKHLGGSCVNFGCTPTKAAIASARLAHLARRAADFGLRIPDVQVDFAAVIERARNIALASRHYHDRTFEESENPKLARGHARLAGRAEGGFRVRVGDDEFMAREVVIDTGTRSAIPPIEGLKDIPFLHAGNWLEATALPEQLAIIGSGAIGLEMAQFYRRLGSRVAVVEAGHQIAGHEDADIADALRKLLEDEGIVFRLGASLKSIGSERGSLSLRLGEGSPIEASHLFVATGRKPNTDDLGLETVSVKMSPQGIIEADERLATNVEGIWVAGDVRGGPQFTHTAWDDYLVLLSQMAGDRKRTTRRVVPYAIFTDPELGRVGMTEQQAREAGHDIKIGRFDMAHSGKAREIGEDKGTIKVVIDAKSEQILGAAVLAVEGAELVHCYIELMNARAPFTVLRDAVQIHPTLGEAVQSAVADL
jgi:pyruvate/2-oxoglutarate dehydrogenase complex dihydrolipoamide dehydrogenase (E3) component